MLSRNLLAVIAAILSLLAFPLHAATPQVAAGGDHNVALKSDGTVWTWGYNFDGELGNGAGPTANATTPVQASGLSGITAVAAGYFHTVALKSDGTVWTWGNNQYGQLGIGNTTNATTPVQVPGLSGMTAVAAGYGHTLALRNDGTVWAWGYDNDKQLGNPLTPGAIWSTTPVQVTGLTGVVAIGAGYYHSIALKSDGTVWAWGDNNHGEIGNGTTAQAVLATQVLNLSGVTAIAANNSYHNLALKGDGTVWAWGANDQGQLGYGAGGANTYSATPAQVGVLSGVTAIGTGMNHSLAVKNDGTVWAWGENHHGQLGLGTADTSIHAMPQQVPGLGNAVGVSGGESHSVALKSDGTVRDWGDNAYGELGDGVTLNAFSPVEVLGVGAQGYLNLLGSVTLSDSDRIFNYGESTYPQFVSPAKAASQTITVAGVQYYYRYYAGTNAYIGTAGGNFYYLGPASGNQLLLLGTVASWLATAAAAGF